ncbi:hypothetical protein J8J14_23530 [Roseomonas sp. SSH11]|uniref:Uncharacterized protein n=1 Tax=Pararoseomonas baculiformis TaxID=2820812 RepID=A0ABS4AL14_9PROT|nr:hypothetical protein [Pararoseomonas baculiformis]MBP0447727.1 hypothetical protein [Pararoseomonas baculiformis]
MADDPRGDQADTPEPPEPSRPGSDLEVYAEIDLWLIVECCQPGQPPTQHPQGYIRSHARLSKDGRLRGAPYISTPLQGVDTAAGFVLNQEHKRIVLVEPAMPEDELLDSIVDMRKRAERSWGLSPETVWRRVI